MFYYISGRLCHLEPSFAVVDAGGVGYKLTISANTHAAMPPHLTVSEPPTVKLYSYMSVREDGVELFGFADEEELSFFKLLITVSGVGPKAAISILSQLTPHKLALAICTDDKKSIAKANGIGPKTAARIVLELKDKLSKESYTAYGDDDMLSDAATSGAVSDNRRDAEDALTVLGYSRTDAARALSGVDASLGVDDMIRIALKKLMK